MTTLTLSWAFERARYGRRARAVPSRFLFEAQGEDLPRGWVGVEATLAPEADEPKPARRGKKKAGRGRAGAGKTAQPQEPSTPRR